MQHWLRVQRKLKNPKLRTLTKSLQRSVTMMLNLQMKMKGPKRKPLNSQYRKKRRN